MRSLARPGVFGGGRVGALRALERAVIAHSSPEPAAACWEGLVGWRECGASGARACSEGACSEGAGRRTPCAERAVITQSSPEPSAGLLGGACGVARVRSLACPGVFGGGRVGRGAGGVRASAEPRVPGLVRRQGRDGLVTAGGLGVASVASIRGSLRRSLRGGRRSMRRFRAGASRDRFRFPRVANGVAGRSGW